MNSDPEPTPIWVTDPEAVGPCPCGRDINEGVLVITGDVPLSRWFHPDCLDFLKHEMDEEEIEEMERWNEDQ